MTEIKIDEQKFYKRLEKLRSVVQDPLAIFLGSKMDLEQANLNSALCNYLLGYEFPNTVILLSKNVVIFGTKKRLDFFENISGIETHIIDKTFENISDISSYLVKIPNLCCVDLKKIKGNFCDNILKNINVKDISDEIQTLFLYKDFDEIENCKKAGIIMNYIIKNCTEYVKDNTFNLDKLEDFIERPIDGIDTSNVEYGFAPEISRYSYRIGIRYNGYCAEAGRTVYSDMNIFYNTQKFILNLIRVGDNSKIIYEKVKEYLINNDLEVDDNFLYTTGLLNEEVSFANEFRVRNGLVFVLKLSNGFSILSNTFYMNDVPVFITLNDKYEDYLDKRPRFRDKSREYEHDIRRKEHQKELLEKLIEDQLNFYKSKSNKNLETDSEKKCKTYSKEGLIPRKGKIVVDFMNNAVCIPLGEYVVPFHISSIKNVVLVDETILKFNFDISQNKNLKFLSSIKCINVNDKNGRQIYDDIQNLKNNFSVCSDKEIITQDKLIESSKKATLENVFMRTDIKTAVKKRKTGNLELHENGFRFSEDKIDILFSNIKHAFFIKGDVQNRTILHFYLNNPILVNLKKTKNIQFYQEAGINLTYNTHKRGDEHMEFIMEKEEQDKQKRLNYLFENFVSSVENTSQLKIQKPKDGFYGVPLKESVLVQRTHECLVALHEQPFFVVTLDDIEIVNFERVAYNVKTSDVMFIFKDKSIPPAKILSIESAYMNKFKDYLDSNNIVFMETIFNIQWKNVLKKIMEDPISFYECGGWTELVVQDEESEESEESSDITESSTESVDSESTGATTISSEYSTEEESSYEESSESDMSVSSDEDDYKKKRRR